ncbi:hypothetical protein FNV43_RR02402 [Rhamnella rubrinervis]|uniref:RNase H type-1 domain-containing protein n=1 Tax=Rhamnella rubrinervis TaxID=2594499 RepID=A0A8K0HSZ9_9ROSA|nr:hypothetical protein FNV43_RR02402 [Rhamnella rubrinervis]
MALMKYLGIPLPSLNLSKASGVDCNSSSTFSVLGMSLPSTTSIVSGAPIVDFRRIIQNITNLKGLYLNQGDFISTSGLSVKEDKERIFERRPWSMDSTHLILKEWSTEENLQDIEFNTSTFYIQVHGLPPKFIHQGVALKIGHQIGGLHALSVNCRSVVAHRFLRFRLDIKVADLIPAGFFQSRDNEGEHWIQFKYERLPDFCFCWGGWSPPQQGYIKINVDAKFVDGRAASAMVVRNDHGHPLYLASKLLKCESSFVAEAEALYWAAEYAETQGWKVMWKSRRSSMVADAIAKKSLSSNSALICDEYSLETIPSCILNLIYAEQANAAVIEGQIPKWFWGIAKKKLDFLDLSGNMLQGSLNVPPLFVSFFGISNNNLTGKIHPSFRNWTYLKVLNKSKNHFSRTIPQWLGNFLTSLDILNLQGKNFHGSLPQIFTNGSMLHLTKLELSHNALQEKVPQFLINCSKLQVLNLGQNQISDTFPSWLQSLPELQVLVLQ